MTTVKVPFVPLDPTGKKMMFTLKANDQEEVECPEDVAFQSRLIKKMISDLGIVSADDPRLKDHLPVSNLDGWTLKKIMAWCEAHKGEEFIPKEDYEDQRCTLTPEDEEYLNINNEQLMAILLGANYLDIPGLIEIITQKVANMATGKSVEELRTIYCLPNDFTAEEEEQMKKRYEWVEA